MTSLSVSTKSSTRKKLKMSKYGRCDECRYWEHKDVRDWDWKGICHRYPQGVTTNESHWCGEFTYKRGKK